jgi:flagellar protein FlaI
LKYYVIRDFIGLEKIESFMNDKFIEDISCDGINIPIYVYHRNPRLGSIKTNVIFSSGDELDSFVNKISERCGKTISVAKPLLDGTLPDGSRVQATLGSDIARQGSNFTIRMFTEKPLTPIDIINFNTADLKSMAYFWLLVEHGFSILVSGGTATGKTSLLNVLSLFIKPQMKIVSIEDTAELRLSHPHWVPEVARTPISEEGKVDMFELLRESLRQRPDYIIVGEVRGKEAYVLFQQMAVGHAGLSTMHAENFTKLIDRLVSPPINLPANLIQNLDLIIFMKRVRKGRKYHRRINSIIEVVGYDAETKNPIINEIMTWDPKDDKIKIINKSYLLKKIADMTNMTESEVHEDITHKANVLKWVREHNITDYRKISSIINLYYTSPDFLLGKIEEEI